MLGAALTTLVGPVRASGALACRASGFQRFGHAKASRGSETIGIVLNRVGNTCVAITNRTGPTRVVRAAPNIDISILELEIRQILQLPRRDALLAAGNFHFWSF